MSSYLVNATRQQVLPITPIGKAALKRWLGGPGEGMRSWVESTRFEANAGETCLVPGRDGKLARVLLGVDATDDHWAYAGLPTSLPEGVYRIDAALSPQAATRAALGWALAAYSFTNYRKAQKRRASLLMPKGADDSAVARTVEGMFLARDLINTPASDMGPAELADAARKLARKHNATLEVIVGDRLLKRNYPLIHAVGRASARAPRLIDLRWGPKTAPKLTLVG